MTDPVQPQPSGKKHTNRLAQESSPYLLQHAHNPVDWHAWGSEAFEIARRENKPIFLSVGYSTCYWCHVMERQSFENEAVAAEMNQRFVNIKVDREERPDVDQLYMTAVQILTRQGGWPMSVFLLPDLRPFYGGTYFPPTDMYGRPGFVSILRGIEDAYRNRPADVEKSAAQITNMLRQYAEPPAPQAPIEINQAFINDLILRSASDYDSQFGGFGGAPKFPRETLLELLLVYQQTAAAQSFGPGKIREMLRHTLDALAAGGIRDHLGGGFHRYSTDGRWLVPHFEIMLYDNAMLAWCYAESYRQSLEPRDAETARGVFDFILREMTSPQGGFYTALDAEVDSREGLNYLWTAAEIDSILGPHDASLFNKAYGVDRGPNFADPHHGAGTPDANILFLPQSLAESAAELKMELAALQARLAPMREKLYEVRQKRKQPLLDTKIITSWNALMIRALAHGGAALGEARYIAAAEKAAEFLLQNHRAPDGGLFRTSRDGVAKYAAFLDDYAFLTQALLALGESTGNRIWRDRAEQLAAVMIEKFADAESGGFYFTQKDALDLIIRQKTASDSPLPSGNAVAAMALLELGDAAAAQRVIAEFAEPLQSHGEGMSAMVQAAMLCLRSHGPFTVARAGADAPGDRPESPQEIASKIVTIESSWSSAGELHVHLHIRDGFHINAHDVAMDGLIATNLAVSDDATAAVEYPPAEHLSVEFAEDPLRVYSGRVTLIVRWPTAPPQAKAPLKLALTYQACDDAACLPPVTKIANAERFDRQEPQISGA